MLLCEPFIFLTKLNYYLIALKKNEIFIAQPCTYYASQPFLPEPVAYPWYLVCQAVDINPWWLGVHGFHLNRINWFFFLAMRDQQNKGKLWHLSSFWIVVKNVLATKWQLVSKCTLPNYIPIHKMWDNIMSHVSVRMISPIFNLLPAFFWCPTPPQKMPGSSTSKFSTVFIC